MLRYISHFRGMGQKLEEKAVREVGLLHSTRARESQDQEWAVKRNFPSSPFTLLTPAFLTKTWQTSHQAGKW